MKSKNGSLNSIPIKILGGYRFKNNIFAGIMPIISMGLMRENPSEYFDPLYKPFQWSVLATGGVYFYNYFRASLALGISRLSLKIQDKEMSMQHAGLPIGFLVLDGNSKYFFAPYGFHTKNSSIFQNIDSVIYSGYEMRASLDARYPVWKELIGTVSLGIVFNYYDLKKSMDGNFLFAGENFTIDEINVQRFFGILLSLGLEYHF
jgi:hypothetical protein